MKHKDEHDSDELFDFTAKSSDNYVPNSTSSSDNGNNSSNRARKLTRNIYDELFTSEPDPVSDVECDVTTSGKLPSDELICKNRYRRFSELIFYYQLHGISVKPMFSCFDKERTT